MALCLIQDTKCLLDLLLDYPLHLNAYLWHVFVLDQLSSSCTLNPLSFSLFYALLVSRYDSFVYFSLPCTDAFPSVRVNISPEHAEVRVQWKMAAGENHPLGSVSLSPQTRRRLTSNAGSLWKRSSPMCSCEFTLPKFRYQLTHRHMISALRHVYRCALQRPAKVQTRGEMKPPVSERWAEVELPKAVLKVGLSLHPTLKKIFYLCTLVRVRRLFEELCSRRARWVQMSNGSEARQLSAIRLCKLEKWVLIHVQYKAERKAWIIFISNFCCLTSGLGHLKDKWMMKSDEVSRTKLNS